MPDNKTQTRPLDAKRIDANADYELRYWSKKFGVTPELVRNAVKKVGTSARAVGMHLRKTAPFKGESQRLFQRAR
jgi:hypothetical protein